MRQRNKQIQPILPSLWASAGFQSHDMAVDCVSHYCTCSLYSIYVLLQSPSGKIYNAGKYSIATGKTLNVRELY